MAALTREETEALIQEVLEIYPEQAKKDRAKHLAVNDQSLEKSNKCITSNRKSLPGVMTIRGCAYAGSKGVVWGPIKDMIHISHGPVGCGQYSRAGRRNYYVGTTGVNTFGTINFTSDFQEKDIVFGGDKKLAKIMNEIEGLFPLHKGISIQSECPIGLIGDDIELDVFQRVFENIDIPIVSFKGYLGHTMSACGLIESAYGLEAVKNRYLQPNYNLSDPLSDDPRIINEAVKLKNNIFMKASFGFGGRTSIAIFESLINT